MSTQAPQVLSRRANGVLPSPASQTSEPTKVITFMPHSDSSMSDFSKGKGSHENSGPGKSRGRGSNARSTEATKNTTEGDAPKPAKTKAHNEGEKLVIRRLPPGMTEPEFVSILGSDWDLGKGKVDWFSFAPGKISTDPSKPSRPGRAYVHVMRKDDIMALSDVVRTAVWEDAKATFTNPSLIGPPSVEFAIYKKVPGNKKRTDARQGTIDQDPEFMAFLEDLANPAPPKETTEGDDVDELGKAETKVTTTPLIEYLKEKKANKTKDSASSKNAKHGQGESRSGKGKGSSKEDEPSKKKGKESKAEKTPKETVKILTKKATPEQTAESSKPTAKQASDANAQESAPKSRRAGILAAARILQRDLGLSPGSAHRKARQDAAKADADAKATSSKENAPPVAAPATTERPTSPVKSTETPPQPVKGRAGAGASSKAQSSGRRTRGGKNTEKNKEKEKEKDKDKDKEGASSQGPAANNPPVVLLRKKGSDAESNQATTQESTAPQPAATQASGSKAANTSGGPKGGSNKTGTAQKKPPTVSADATRGFVKHANPSQGVTEALLKQALEVFGTITFVEIDKRKGFAYVDFAEHDGLVKAVTSSPITVAQGTVQVLERKDKKPTNTTTASGASGSAASEKTSGRGRRGRGGGSKAKDSGSNNQSATASTATATNGGG
ncbi:hypothetical protein FDECE_1420 [Fusarium decemcellulare]|nr:hypothetical protein FDECE_1420 [Fusarium decemcellulare]